MATDPVAEARALATPPRLVRRLADEVERLRADLDKVRTHIDQRPEYVTACREAHPDNRADYWRWQGGAEARRQLAQRLGWTVPYEPGEKTGPKPTEETPDAD